MCTQAQLKNITDEISKSAKSILGDKLHKIILYGSYARGDYTNESDVDIMVLADIKNEEIYPFDEKICETTSKLGMENKIMVSVFIKDKQFFDEYLHILPFYQNVIKDGVELYAN